MLSQGYLTKVGQRWKSHKRRWFVITFYDIRYYENRVRPTKTRAVKGSNEGIFFPSFPLIIVAAPSTSANASFCLLCRREMSP